MDESQRKELMNELLNGVGDLYEERPPDGYVPRAKVEKMIMDVMLEGGKE